MSDSLSKDDDLCRDDGTFLGPGLGQNVEPFDDMRTLSEEFGDVKLDPLVIDQGPEFQPRGPHPPQIKAENGNRSSCAYSGQSGVGWVPDSRGRRLQPKGELHQGVGDGFRAPGFPTQSQAHHSLSADDDIECDRDLSIQGPSLNPHFNAGTPLKHGSSNQPATIAYPPTISGLIRPATGVIQGQGQTLQSLHGQLPAGYHGFPRQPVAMETESHSRQTSVSLDENGESQLHWLSAVPEANCGAVFQHLHGNGVVSASINLPNRQQQTPLFLAAQQGNVTMTKLLLNHRADPNIQGAVRHERDTYLWRSPLHLAAMEGDRGLDILRLLLACPATKVDIRTRGDNVTALHLALKCHRERRNATQTIFTLLEHGADYTLIEERSGRSPLMLALETRDLSLVKQFLNSLDAGRCRSLLQEQMRSGDTCLHVAAGLTKISSQEKEMLLRLLVTMGANGNVPNNGKELPRDYARVEWDRMRIM